ncbi:hypothetical protein ACVWZA_002577 [Sphingomonas sp. UYAg733]
MAAMSISAPPRHGEGDRALLQRAVEGALPKRNVAGPPPPPASLVPLPVPGRI